MEGWGPLPEDREELLALAMEANVHGDSSAKRRGVVPEAAPAESALEHKWAPEEDTSLPEDAMVDLLAMLEEDDTDEGNVASPPPAASKRRFFRCATSLGRVCSRCRR